MSFVSRAKVKLGLTVAFAVVAASAAAALPSFGPVDRELTDDQRELLRASGRLITVTGSALRRDRAFADRFGCQLVPENGARQPLEIRLNLTARRDVPRARRLVRRARAARWTTIAVISHRYRASVISKIFVRLRRRAAQYGPGVEIARASTVPPASATRRCPGVGIGLRRTDPPIVPPRAEDWAKRARQRYGADRVTIGDLFPGDITPRTT